MEHYLDLIKDPSHWAFELTVELVTSGLIGAILYPKIKEVLEHLNKHK